ncbi:beta-glucosidase 12-like isoform X1 [Quercus lobata]|uniref:beta-glucosidase 12-like isoform X1 n=1 Tax=Quercus lobata TaxID=97700 RepID=UPI0012459EA6|nr:beta-glucosidase 12-like isoform X1 [Quercus lobata]
MAFQGYLVLGLLVLLDLLTNGIAVSPSHDTASLNRTSFPKDFIFGTASAAYQYEGAAKEGGRGPSTWDIFTHRYPGKIANGSNGDIAVDQYHCYKGDVRIMKKMGLDAYRFSISWSRVLPKGKLSGGVNREGIKYYNKLINRLLARGIQPFVTLLHLDPPQTLEDEYGGFLSPHIMNDFRDYAELCFKEFGDRVKHWITLNEPLSYTNAGYVMGTSPPGRCSSWQQLNCTGGDSGTEPYLVSHNQLLAHASAVKIYKQKYQQVQKGIMGISLNTDWYVPFSNARHDHDAALRALDFKFGWFMDPLTNGDYPHSMRSLVGDRLPKFTKHQSKLVKGSLDFLGLNYYTANYVADALHSKVEHASYITDLRANISSAERNGIPIGPKAASEWLRLYPKGIRDLLLYIKTKYHDPLIFITENGTDEFNDPTLSLEEALADNYRIDYFYRHFQYIHRAIKDGVNVKGYFAWSLLDNFEWNSGYTVRFGINYVDYKNGLKRHPKLSALWFKKFLKK